MRPTITRLCIPAVALALLVTTVVSAAEKGAVDAVVGVRQLMEHVEDYDGPLRIEGVVSRVFDGKGMIALIDTAEFRACKVVTCAKLILPVRWDGAMPAIQDIVEAAGEVRTEGMRKVFVARSLRTVP